MSVIERAFHAWHLLAPKWRDYLLAAGLDLTKTSRESFANDMLRRVSVNFRLRGLEDFCRSACRGIEPGDPARSLLYHVLASPGVMPDGIEEEDYADPAQIQVIENLVYGIVHRRLKSSSGGHKAGRWRSSYSRTSTLQLPIRYTNATQICVFRAPVSAGSAIKLLDTWRGRADTCHFRMQSKQRYT